MRKLYVKPTIPKYLSATLYQLLSFLILKSKSLTIFVMILLLNDEIFAFQIKNSTYQSELISELNIKLSENITFVNNTIYSNVSKIKESQRYTIDKQANYSNNNYTDKYEDIDKITEYVYDNDMNSNFNNSDIDDIVKNKNMINNTIRGANDMNNTNDFNYVFNELKYDTQIQSNLSDVQSNHQIENENNPEDMNSTKQLSILGLFELSTRNGLRPEGISELHAARLAIEHVNQHRILPGYHLKLYANDTMSDPGVGVDRYFHALYTENSTRMIMLLGTACSEVTETLAKIVPYWSMVQVSFGSTSPALSDRTEFPFFFRTVAPDSSHNKARIAFIRRFGWDAVISFSQNEEEYSLSTNELVTELESANITCIASLTFSLTDYKEQLKHLRELDTHVIVGSFSSQILPSIFCEAYILGLYGSDYAWIISGRSVPVSQLPCPIDVYTTALEGVILVSSYNELVENDPEPISGMNYDRFQESIRTPNLPISTYATQVYDAVWAITLALKGAQQYWTHNKRKTKLNDFDYGEKYMAEQFMKQLSFLNFTGVSGPLSFNGPDRLGTTAFYQIQRGTTHAISLYRGSVASWWCEDCVKWSNGNGPPVCRRLVRLRSESPAVVARGAVAVLSAAGAALATTFLVFNLHYANLRSIKLSSPRLNNMTLVGCIFVYMAVAMLCVETDILPEFVTFSAICTSRVYLLAAGFSLAFGSMFAKTYRVHRIFISKYTGMCRTKLLRDTQLISLVCALLVIDGLVVTLWVTTDPMEGNIRNLTKEISTTERGIVYQPQLEVCKSRNMSSWLSAIYAYKGLLLIVGVYMAWETRHVKISALNDSKYIGISVYCVVITSAGVVVLGNIISERITLSFIIITGLILLTTTGTLCLLFLPKLVKFLRNQNEDDPVIQSMGLKVEYNTRRFVIEDPLEIYYRVEIQNKVYRKEVIALDQEILRLEKLIEAHSKRMDTINVNEGESRRNSQRVPSISGGLPLLLLSVLPPVIPRASWPSAFSADNSEMRKSVTFSSQPKLSEENNHENSDLKNMLLNRNREGNVGLFDRIKNLFVSRSSSRKSSTISINGNNQGIASAIRAHVGVITGLVPNITKERVSSCNILNFQNKDHNFEFSRSGPSINIICDDSSDVQKDNQILYDQCRDRSKSQNFEPKVYFQIPEIHLSKSNANLSAGRPKDKRKDSPKYPHRIVTATIDTRFDTNIETTKSNHIDKYFKNKIKFNELVSNVNSSTKIRGVKRRSSFCDESEKNNKTNKTHFTM